MVEKLRLNLHIPYVMSLVDFITGAFDNSALLETHDTASTLRPSATTSAAQTSSTFFSVYGSLKQPEIVLYADPTIIDSRILVLYVSSFQFTVVFQCSDYLLAVN